MTLSGASERVKLRSVTERAAWPMVKGSAPIRFAPARGTGLYRQLVRWGPTPRAS